MATVDEYASYIQQAESLLYDQHQPITYKILSYLCNVPFNTAKSLLYIIHNNAVKDSKKLITTYYISGRSTTTNEYTVTLINDHTTDINTIQSQYSPLITCYIHSISPYNNKNNKHSNIDVYNTIYDLNLKQQLELYQSDKWLDNNVFRSNEYSHIQHTVQRKATKYTNVNSVALNVHKTDAKPLQSTKSKITDTPVQPTDVNEPVTLQPQNTAKSTTKPTKTNTVKSNFFGAPKSSVIPFAAAVAAVDDKPVKTSPERKLTSITSMFHSQIQAKKDDKQVISDKLNAQAKQTENHDQMSVDESVTTKTATTTKSTKSKSKSKPQKKSSASKKRKQISDDDEPHLSDSDVESEQLDEIEPVDKPTEQEQEPDVMHNWVDPDEAKTGMNAFVKAGVNMSTQHKPVKQTKQIEQTYQNDKGYFCTELVDVCIDCLQRDCTCVQTMEPAAVIIDDTKENDTVTVKSESKSVNSKSTPNKTTDKQTKKPTEPATKRAKTDDKVVEKPKSKPAATTKNISSFFTKK